MAEPQTKRVKTGDDAPYELIYWPGLPGRGEFVRLLFEESGTSYVDHSTNPDKVIPKVMELIGEKHVGDDSNPPIFAPPALKHGDLLLHQTPNILLYLAPKLGLAPTEGDTIFHLNQIVLTLLDGFVAEMHETHHPIATSLYYKDQKPEAKKRSKAYIEERVPKFLAYAQRALDAKTSGEGPWLYGDKLTYADLVLFQCLHGTEYAFPKCIGKMKESGKYASVFKLYDAVEKRPNIKSYFASDRRQAYGEGIWRHYPELEEE